MSDSDNEEHSSSAKLYQDGLSGSSYDRHVQQTSLPSKPSKLQTQYWTTKQAVMKKLGKKEDHFVVAGDAELDAKLEIFRFIQKSCMDLLRVIEKYQENIIALSQEENSFGRFLKSQATHDKTRAGKMMVAVGKSLGSSSQQRLALRAPLVRLYQEVETFRYRAISDTLMTINRMESARTEYRGSLLWMKDISNDLDPDTYKQLEKFRKVQSQVRVTKGKFDKLKTDVCQKVDLLGASRSNMFSHSLATYQNTLLHFWEKTSHTMAAVLESFKGYQHYEFNMLKDLTAESKHLAEVTGGLDNIVELQHLTEDEQDLKDLIEPSKMLAELTSRQQTERENDRFDEDETAHYDLNEHGRKIAAHSRQQNEKSSSTENDQEKEEREMEEAQNISNRDRLISFGEREGGEPEEEEEDLDEYQKLFGEDGKKFESLNVEDQEFISMMSQQKFKDKMESAGQQEGGVKDLLSEEPGLQLSAEDQDDMAILNQILGTQGGPGADSDFAHEWQAVFGTGPVGTPNLAPGETDSPEALAQYLPSNLMDYSTRARQMILAGQQQALLNTATVGGGPQPFQQPLTEPNGTGGGGQPAPQPLGAKPQPRRKQTADMSTWFNLFADLDPLANPDEVGKKDSDQVEERNC